MKKVLKPPADLNREEFKKLTSRDRRLCSCGRSMEYHQHFEEWKCAICGWEDEQ